jgi:two-component system response regulator AtoC
MSKHKIVILEKNPGRRDYLKSIISGWGYTPFIFEKETICFDNLSSLNPDLVILGPLSQEKTFRFINTLQMRNNSLPVLIFSSDHAIEDFIHINGYIHVSVVKAPLEQYEMKIALDKIKDKKLDDKMNHNRPLIIGNNPEMVKIKELISKFSRSKEAVLIQGEPGTGKELVAKAIHHMSDRRNNPFVKVNSAVLTSEMFERELFGYNEGFYADTHPNKKGMFAVAHKGTVFLNELGMLPDTLQAWLLHALEGGYLVQPGFEGKEPVDLRIISATSTDLGAIVDTGEFRKDLFFRLNVINISIPPLRNRIDDIPLLSSFFNDKFCWESNRSHYELSNRTKQMLNCYHWPGNVRELKNAIKHSVVTGNEMSLVENLLMNDQKKKSNDFIDCCEDIYIHSELSNVKEWLKDLNKISLKDICKKFVVKTERKLMEKALETTNWNRKKAAMLLNISYKSLLNKIKDYKLT